MPAGASFLSPGQLDLFVFNFVKKNLQSKLLGVREEEAANKPT